MNSRVLGTFGVLSNAENRSSTPQRLRGLVPGAGGGLRVGGFTNTAARRMKPRYQAEDQRGEAGTSRAATSRADGGGGAALVVALAAADAKFVGRRRGVEKARTVYHDWRSAEIRIGVAVFVAVAMAVAPRCETRATRDSRPHP
jgi:hypothetical protein